MEHIWSSDCWTWGLISENAGKADEETYKQNVRQTVAMKWSHIFLGQGPANMADVWSNTWINAELLCAAAKLVSITAHSQALK